MTRRQGIDLVVVSYHSGADLAKFVQSYNDSKPPDFETRLLVFLVEAEAQEIADATLMAPFELCWSPKNIGYNRACNAAADILAESPSDVLAFFNADTELRPGVLEGCYHHLMSDEKVGIVGPRQVNRMGRITHAGIVGTQAAPAHRGWRSKDRGQFNDVVDCVTVSGSAYFIKTSVFDELGVCETFRIADPAAKGGAFLTCRHYYGETWTSYHAAAHGYRVLYVGDVPPMIHEWHQASPQGGWGEQNLVFDKEKFRSACRMHAIPHD